METGASTVRRWEAAASRRSDSSFEEFYRGNFRAVLRATFAWTNDARAAEDAVQEAFSRAFARWNRLRNEGWVAGWVITTAINVARKQASRRAKEPKPERATPVEAPSLTRVSVVGALRSLPPRQRQAAVLRYIADYRVREVAELMSISEGAAKSHLAKAREALSELMDPSVFGAIEEAEGGQETY